MNGLFRLIMLLGILGTAVAWPAAAAPLSDAETALVSLYRAADTIDAVRIDIERFSVYRKGNHGLWEERIGEDLKTLQAQKAAIATVVFPEGLELTRMAFLPSSDGLSAYGDAFLNSAPRDAEKAEDLFVRRFDRFRERLAQAAAEKIAPQALTEDFDPLDEEFKVFSNETDREEFRRASSLLEEKKYADALSALTTLRDKYRGAPSEGSIVLRMVRAVLQDNRATVPAAQEEAQIKLLAELIDNRVYYPNAYDIYIEWRSLYQGFYYGVSSDVEIPNLMYLQKLDVLIETLTHRIASDPPDEWARSQLWMLVRLPLIGRSGSAAEALSFSGVQ
jgi:hypothetical protein